MPSEYKPVKKDTPEQVKERAALAIQNITNFTGALTVEEKPTGRPTSMTEVVKDKFKLYRAKGLDIKACCGAVGISPPTYYNYIKKDVLFAEEMDRLEGSPQSQAEMNVADDVFSGNMNSSKWLLERTSTKYNPKVVTENLTLTGTIGELLQLAKGSKVTQDIEDIFEDAVEAELIINE